MRIHITKEARKRRASDSQAGSAPVALEKQPVPSQPVSSCDDLQARIAKRAIRDSLGTWMLLGLCAQ